MSGLQSKGPGRTSAAENIERVGVELLKGATIYAKALMLFAASALLLFSFLFVLTESLITAQFAEMENRLVRNDLGRIVGQIERDLDHLRSTTTDWSNWTELHDFTTAINPGFPGVNLNREVLRVLNLDYIGIWNREGTLLAQQTSYENNPLKVSKILESLETQNFLLPTGLASVRSGALVLPERVAIAVSSPIRDSQRKKQPGGMLAMLRFLTPERLNSLKPSLNSTLQVLPLPSMLDSPDFHFDAIELLASGSPVVRPIDEENVVGAALIRGVDRVPVAAVLLVQPRDVYAAGIRAIRIFLLAMTAAGGGLVVVLWFVIDWNLLRRIGRMDRGVRLLRATGDLPKELDFRSDDELGRLARSIREMSHSLREAEANYRRLFESSRDGTVVLSFPKLLIEDVNPAFCELILTSREDLLGRHLAAALPLFPCEEMIGQMREHGSFLDHEVRLQVPGRENSYVEVIGVLFGDGATPQLQLNFRDVSERKRFESTMRELSGKLLRLQDEERRKIARELHDSTAQNLSALEMNMSLLQKYVPARNSDAVQLVLQSREIAENCSREIRTLSYLLHPPLLDEVGLIFAIRWFVEGYTGRTGISVQLQIPESFPRLSNEKETGLFRIIQESLTNVYRHSGSRAAWVTLRETDGKIQLEIGDKGSGFRTVAGRTPISPGLGLAGMRERMRQLGGEFSILSGQAGTVVRVAMPVE